MNSSKKSQPEQIIEAMILDSEAAVMANFEFLGQTDVEISDDDEISDDCDMGDNDESDIKTSKRKIKSEIMNDGKMFFLFN